MCGERRVYCKQRNSENIGRPIRGAVHNREHSGRREHCRLVVYCNQVVNHKRSVAYCVFVFTDAAVVMACSCWVTTILLVAFVGVRSTAGMCVLYVM